MFTILVVDDEPFIRASMASLRDWRQDGYLFQFEAGNGQQALELLAAHPEIDIVLLDLVMPVLDGIGFLKALPAALATRAEPAPMPAVVVLSAHDSFALVRQAFTLGAGNYLLKTEVDGDSLKAILDRSAADLASRRQDARGRLDAGNREFLATQVLRDLLAGPLPGEWETLTRGLGIELSFPLTIWSIWVRDFEAVQARHDQGELARFTELFLRTVRQDLERRGGGQAVPVARNHLAVLGADALAAQLQEAELAESLERYLNVQIEIRRSPALPEAGGIAAAWEELGRNRSATSRIVVLTQRYLRQHFRRPGIGLDELAAHVGVSRNHLSWEFSRETGETITDQLAKLRVEEACRLLASTNLKVYEIAPKVGYPSVEHFCRVFKRVTGHSPNNWSAEVSAPGGRPRPEGEPRESDQ
jgi:AraC-like DNA-binding protein/DNA-binding NarL/FixJ family response regulator